MLNKLQGHKNNAKQATGSSKTMLNKLQGHKKHLSIEVRNRTSVAVK
jgi:hypothetical protein